MLITVMSNCAAHSHKNSNKKNITAKFNIAKFFPKNQKNWFSQHLAVDGPVTHIKSMIWI